jgi:transcription initiation factor TFIIH subunit 4
MRLPDMVVATLTRRSVLTAMRKGLSAGLIEHFLRAHVHPSARVLGVPENVTDQLHLWEREQRCVERGQRGLVGIVQGSMNM